MSEGSLEAPIRHPIGWNDPDFHDEASLDAELRRVFDICHGCRRCFNLCDSFPRLFDLIDESKTGELDSVDSAGFKPVVDACTLCDMCFMTKCPYVPPHEFNLDFPHLMLRYRAVEAKKGRVPWAERQLIKTDRNGNLAGHIPGLCNWASDTGNKAARGALETVAGIDRGADLPKYHGRTFAAAAGETVPKINRAAPAHGRKAVLYATCFANYNNPSIGAATQAVLARNGVETEVVYPRCCGMPQLEKGLLEEVAESAAEVAAEMWDWIEKGYDIVALVPSCALMMKFEWPLILPDDANVRKLSAHCYDVTQYVVDISKTSGLADGLGPLDGDVTLHIPCHARAQNMGQKATEMLRLLPDTEVQVIERCSGHGGAWGVMKGNFETALKVGRPVARDARKAAKSYVVSECPLAGAHILQGMERIEGEGAVPTYAPHPIELMAKAYGIEV
jgi:glycerol-3-phosphate dehydrogenase subunit C